nr:MAG TPA: hypothetical protein [Caudoviricetes sp.]DAW73701.1 MAG TPA: hypothetical protein [Bacteriophage sp.]DAI50320.1 MAG TPA: hypothetical protein [Caudoviricetes sp.]DAP57561.1 MAG TPA: hypothetical protein [Caudoviricetes sp.]DAR70005.1 MAG TPA: hypothetical protein [Caudoviricetes sp.]
MLVLCCRSSFRTVTALLCKVLRKNKLSSKII